jgi:hypothetical protein
MEVEKIVVIIYVILIVMLMTPPLIAAIGADIREKNKKEGKKWKQ